MTKRITGSQPEPVRQRIYGSLPVEPLGGPSDQPEVLPHTKVYGVKQVPTVKVTLKDGDPERTLRICESDFDDAVHERVD